MQFDNFIREMIRDAVREELAAVRPPDPEMISIAETATRCGVGRAVIDDLVKDAETNGFPAVKFGPKSIQIDYTRLRSWIAAGGLIETKTEPANVTPFRRAG